MCCLRRKSCLSPPKTTLKREKELGECPPIFNRDQDRAWLSVYKEVRRVFLISRTRHLAQLTSLSIYLPKWVITCGSLVSNRSNKTVTACFTTNAAISHLLVINSAFDSKSFNIAVCMSPLDLSSGVIPGGASGSRAEEYIMGRPPGFISTSLGGKNVTTVSIKMSELLVGNYKLG